MMNNQSLPELKKQLIDAIQWLYPDFSPITGSSDEEDLQRIMQLFESYAQQMVISELVRLNKQIIEQQNRGITPGAVDIYTHIDRRVTELNQQKGDSK